MPTKFSQKPDPSSRHPDFTAAEFPSLHSLPGLYKFNPMINRADITLTDAAFRGASLRGLLILILL